MVRQLHDGMTARVTDNKDVSQAFAVINGSHVLCHADGRLRGECLGISVAYRTDGQLLNQRRMHFQLHVSTTIAHELPFADDCAVNTTSERDMQRSMDLFAAACDNGLVINTKETVVIYQPPPYAFRTPSETITFSTSAPNSRVTKR
nr:unnamed protein product [Spirometra erinaceieuropaei]